MSEDKNELLTQYHNIAAKLKKKRILKKPNVAEASQQFENLALNFEREDLPQYSGLSYEAAAKCQNTLGCHLEEALLLLKANKQFMKSYTDEYNSKFVPNPSLLDHSLMSFQDCLDRLEKSEEPYKHIKDVFMGNIIYEFADNLKTNAGLNAEAVQEFKKCLKFLSNVSLEKINCLKQIVSLKLQSKDFRECLTLINQIIKETKYLPDNGIKEEILRDSEITRIFLLLILQPTIQQISPEDASVLEKYAWVETSSSSCVQEFLNTPQNKGSSVIKEEDLFINLQSLVMACQYSEAESLELIEKDLASYLNPEQKNLLQILIKQYNE